MVQNKGLIFTKIPTTFPEAGEHLVIKDRPLDLDRVEIPEDGLLVKNHYASFDPFQRGKMRDEKVKSYSPAYPLDSVVRNATVSTVLKSKNSKYEVGDILFVGYVGAAEEYSIFGAENVNAPFVRKIENPHNLDVKLFLGALGMPGLTAYAGFYEIGKAKKGETIFISAASGAVGALVGQIAKHEGLKVIGSVGDDKKLEYIKTTLGFDDGFVYKKEKPGDALKRLAPDGIDIYWENVGGEHLEAALNSLNQNGRIVACGMISGYNSKPQDLYPLRNIGLVIPKRIKIQGFIVGDKDFGPKYAKEHQERMQQWIKDGAFKADMFVTKGIDNAAQGLIGIFHGHNFGKAVLEIASL